MTRNITVADTTMARVRAILPDQQVVELVGTIAAYNMVSRFLVATGIEVEE
jgi:alkylhydroperoxidase family enzyme